MPSEDNKKLITGTCACGASTFTSTQPSAHLDYCYCVQCQQTSGAPFVAWTGIPRAALVFSGPIRYVKLSSIATRGFCEECGGSLSLQYDCYPDKTHVAAASILRSDFEMPPVGCHIFVKSKPLWHRIAEDGVPRYAEFDGEFEKMFPKIVKALETTGREE